MSASELETAIAYLRSPIAIRARCENVLEVGLDGRLAHFAIDLTAMSRVVDEVVKVTRARYPHLETIPTFGRMTQLGAERIAALDTTLAALPADERARTWVDLIVASVVLDAGAGDAWRYRDGDAVLARSEGLAVASLRAFEAGLFSADALQPRRVDAAALIALEPRKLAAAFQVTADNPLAGLDGRIGLLHVLGGALAAAPQIFAGARPGGLVDHLRGGALDMPAILRALLDGLSPVWPGRERLGGTPLGDVGRHPAAGGTGPSHGLVPFHNTLQWLAYSLIEPLGRAGLVVTQPGALTGLPEYRNGGLLVDLGVLEPRHGDVRGKLHGPGDELIVEWRALTVALLDRLAEAVRQRLGRSPAQLPLASVLEGGTWAAGRAIAAMLRPGGGPPIEVHPDTMVF